MLVDHLKCLVRSTYVPIKFSKNVLNILIFTGFAPGPLGNCEDVNECVEYGHQCAFRCHNIPGIANTVFPHIISSLE